LYLFESSLEDRKEARDMIKHFSVPAYFRDDILKIMGENKRPPYRWFLTGPKRSGTTVHIDPLGTSAWNTSLQGHKRWVLFPNEIPKEVVKGKKYLDRGEELSRTRGNILNPLSSFNIQVKLCLSQEAGGMQSSISMTLWQLHKML